MRIHFSNTVLPKKAAKRIYDRFGKKDKTSPIKFCLSDAQEVAACLLGYDSWHSLHSLTISAKHAPSPLDEDCPAAEQVERLNYQTDRLAMVTPVIESERRLLAIEFRVSAKNPKSDCLSEQLYSRNSIIWGGDPKHGIREWRFQSSITAQKNRPDTFAICDAWEYKAVTFIQHINSICAALANTPEDPYLIEEFMRVSLETGRLDPVEHRLNDFEGTLLESLPENFPKSGAVDFKWEVLNNRTYIRCCYWLAVCFYETGRYDKAKKWFKLTQRITTVMNDGCKAYLKDLSLLKPTGAVSVWD